MKVSNHVVILVHNETPYRLEATVRMEEYTDETRIVLLITEEVGGLYLHVTKAADPK